MARLSRIGCTALIVGLLLSGCAREPSEADIRRATETMLTSASANPFAQMVAGLAGSGGKAVEVHELNKLGCKKAPDANGYRCDIEIEVSTFGVRQREHTTVRMVRSDAGWMAMVR